MTTALTVGDAPSIPTHDPVPRARATVAVDTHAGAPRPTPGPSETATRPDVERQRADGADREHRRRRIARAQRRAWLWPVRGRVTSGFGRRRAPIGGGRHLHAGADIGCPWGLTVRAPQRGTVVLVKRLPVYGRTVIIRHRDGWRSFIAHLGRVKTQPGRRVEQGDPLGRCGSSGWSTGPHVHFELRRPTGRRVDPMPHLWRSNRILQRARRAR